MTKTWILLLVACGGAQPSPVSNVTPPPAKPTALTLEQDTVVGDKKPNMQLVAREQAIEQAREAGILGSKDDANTPPPGPLNKESIRFHIRERQKGITNCYEVRLLEAPALKGTTTAAFVIGPDGFVIEATASGLDKGVDDCVASVIRSIRFPATSGGKVNVNYPFAFRTAGD